MKTTQQVIWIFGAPRSGTSWLGQIFNSSPDVNFKLQPLFSFAFKDRLNSGSDRQDILNFLDEVSISEDPFVNGKSEITKSYPKFAKNQISSHLVLKHVRYHHLIHQLLNSQPEAKFIGIIRNPCAVINSWLNAPREFDPNWDIEQEWSNAYLKNSGRIEEFFGFDKWLEITDLYEGLVNNYPNQFFMLKYDDLLSNRLKSVIKMFDFCNLKLEIQTIEFLELQTKDRSGDYSVDNFKLNDDGWKKTLPLFIKEAIYKEVELRNLINYL